jgi:hypothetical protein
MEDAKCCVANLVKEMEEVSRELASKNDNCNAQEIMPYYGMWG